MGYQAVLLQSAEKVGGAGSASMDMTKHARVRIQQRGLNRDVLHCLLAGDVPLVVEG